MQRKWFIRSLIAISVALEIYLLYHLPSVLLALMYLVGRSDCSFSKTLDVAGWKIQYVDSEKRIKELSHLAESNGKLELWATPLGEFWMPKGGSISEFGVMAEQELRVYGSGQSGVQPGDVVIDCGADIGTFTRLALEMGASAVIAVEPAPDNQSCLRRTFSREIADGRVKLFPKGVWNKDDFMTLYNPGIYGSVVIKIAPTAGVQIPLTTIDKLVDELHLNRVDFITRGWPSLANIFSPMPRKFHDWLLPWLRATCRNTAPVPTSMVEFALTLSIFVKDLCNHVS
jgi:FkbM family methyltransferase